MKRNNRKATSIRVNELSGFPDTAFVRLKATRFQHLTTVGAGAIVTANSCTDPFGTALGQDQPVGFDTWSAIYSQYMVYAAKITVHYATSDVAGANAPVQTTLVPTSQFGTMTYRQVNGNPYAKTRIIANAYADNPKVMKHYMTSRKIFGLKELDITDHGSSISSNPLQLWYFLFQMNPMDITQPLDMWLQITITQYVKFYDRFAIQPSS